MNKKIKNTSNSLPKTVLIGSGIVLLPSIFCEYFLQIFASLLVLNLIVNLFFFKNKPLIIMFGYLYMWLTISISYFYACFFNEPPENLLYYPEYSTEYMSKAFWLSIIGLLVIAIGTYLAIRSTEKQPISFDIIKKYNTSKIIIFYILYALISAAIRKFVVSVLPGISQLFVFLHLLKWGVFYIMSTTIFIKKEKQNIFWLIVGTEFILGFTSLFSEFKEIIIFTIIAIFSFLSIKRSAILPIIFLGIIIFVVGVFWSYIKPDYRAFLSKGQRAQIIKVSKTEALKKIISYIPDFTKEKFKIGRDVLFTRISYLDFFSATIRYIPYYQKFYEGELTLQAIKHVLMPRFFFPNKKIINDSEETHNLTGIYTAKASQGTSISVGYFAEAYADFGQFWMFLWLFIFGFLQGYIYSLVIKKTPQKIWGYAVIFPMYYQFSMFERNLIKHMGNLFWFLIAAFVFIKFLIPLFEKFIKNE